MSLRRLLPLAALALAACAVAPVIEVGAPAASIELTATPFFAQTAHHCGPAALATVLVADGVATDPEQLSPLIYLPGREGSLQAELIAATRRFQRLPLKLEPRSADLFAALSAGRPVLVLQNLGLRRLPVWHYAVVVGFDAGAQRVILRSGETERVSLALSRFLDTWNRADRWALVIAGPNETPGFISTERWIAAAAPFESLGQAAFSERAYEAALRREPGSALAWQALANTRYARGDRPGSEDALRRALSLAPDSVASRNNLATLLLERGCTRAAKRELDAITEVPPALRAAVEGTRAEVESSATAEAADCPND